MKEIAITFIRSDPRNNSQLRDRETTSTAPTLKATKSPGLRFRSAVCFSQQRYKSPYRPVKPPRRGECEIREDVYAASTDSRRWPSAALRVLPRKRARKHGFLRRRMPGDFLTRRASYNISTLYTEYSSLSFSILRWQRILIAISYEQRRPRATAVI